MAVEQPLAELSVEGPDVSLRLGHGVNALRLEGRVSADGQHLAGKASTMQGNAGTFGLRRTIRPSATAEPLALTGKVQIPDGQTLDLTITFGRTPAGAWVGEIAIPAQGLRGFPLIDIERDGDAIAATLSGPPDAVIKAVFSESDTKLTGHMEQSGLVLPLEVSRSGDVAIAGPKRPQTPAPPFPYRISEFRVPCPGGHVIAGTLNLPDGDGPHAAVVLISGSGQQDRDETIAGHKPFLVIADYLARRGIAVARYDDRGVGESTGVETLLTATSEDFADDAAAVVAWLRNAEAIDSGRIGIIGHSEGGMIAPMVAARDGRIAFIVSLAGSAVSGREILLLQTRLSHQAAGADPASLDDIQAAQAAALDMVVQGADAAALRRATIDLSRRQLAAQGRELPDGPSLEMALDAEIRRATSPWMVYFLEYDPAPALERLTCPVLALNGTLDLQVWHEQNLPVIEAAVKRGGGQVTVKRYDGLNHLFQPAVTGAFAEYAQIETTFDERVLADIVEWISTVAATAR
jgi:pimeloyl-ACP methyl ester carboxylesterase